MQSGSLTPERALREVAAVFRYEFLALVTSARGALFVLAYGLVFCAAGAGMLLLNRELLEATPPLDLLGSIENFDAEQRAAILERLPSRGLGVAVIDLLFSGEVPALLVLLLTFTTISLPALTVLVSFMGIGEELQTRFSRYVFQRVNRGTWLAGKILANWLVILLGIVLVHCLAAVAAASGFGLDLGPFLRALPRVWLGFAFLVLAYVAYTTLIAVVVQPPFGALALGWFGLGVLWVASLSTPLGLIWLGTQDAALWALRAEGFVLVLVQTALFAAGAWFMLSRRDL